MICKSCGVENKETNNFCMNCGKKLKNEDVKPKKQYDVVKTIRNHRYTKYVLTRQKQFIFGFIIGISLLSLLVSFGRITRTSGYTLELGEEGTEFVTYSYHQNPIQMYDGYIKVLRLSSLAEVLEYRDESMMEFTEELQDLREDHYLTSKDFRKLYSNQNVYGLVMTLSSDYNHPFSSSIEFFIPVLLLVIVQLIPIIIGGTTLWFYGKEKDVLRIRYLLLFGGVMGLLLASFLPNLAYKTTAGAGLISYIIFMFLGFIVLQGVMLNKNKPHKKQLLLYGVNVAWVVIIFLAATGSFIRLGFNATNNNTYHTSIQIDDSTQVLDVYQPSFSYVDQVEYLYYMTPQELYDNLYTTKDLRYITRVDNFHYIFMYDLFSSDATQDIFIGVMIGVSSLLLVLSSTLLYITFIYLDHPTGSKTTILKLLIAGCFLVLIVLGVIYTFKLNIEYKTNDISTNARISFGLIIGFLLSAASAILFKFLPNDFNETTSLSTD